MAFVVMCAEKIRRLLRPFLSSSLPGFTLLKGQVAFGWRSGAYGEMRQQICCSLYSQTREVPTTLILGRNRGGLLLVFSGVPV